MHYIAYYIFSIIHKIKIKINWFYFLKITVFYFNLGNKLEDKDKILQILKDEIKEYSKPNQSPQCLKVDNDLTIKKLNRDKIDLEMNCNELKQQVTELEKKHKDLNGKVCKL